MAECSLSTGTIDDSDSEIIFVIISPATTNVSLLAKAIIFPARIAATVGISPLYPTMAVTTMSASGIAAASATASAPACTSIGKSFKASFKFR